MYDKYNKSVQFYVVYIKEAHALDSRSPMVGGNSPLVQEPITFDERVEVAKQCATAMEIKRIPTLVDEIDDGVGNAYSAWPDRLFLVGKNGKIAYASGRGPRGFKPDELSKAIETELAKSKKTANN